MKRALLVAVSAVTAATLVRLALDPLIGPYALPFITFFPAVAFAAWYSGVRSGVAATALSVLVASWAFMAPRFQPSLASPQGWIGLALFAGVATIVLLISHGYHTSRAHVENLLAERHRAALELQKSRADLEIELADMRLLQAASARLISQHGAHELHEQLVETAMAIMGSDFASLQELTRRDGGEPYLHLLAHRGFTAEAARHWEWVPSGSSTTTCSLALDARERIIVSDVKGHDAIASSDEAIVFAQTGIRAAQSTPLLSRRGEVVGVISTQWRQPHTPAERNLHLLDILARQAADWIERKRAESALQLRSAQFETLLNQAPLGVYLVDAHFRIRHVNPVARPVFVDIPDLIGRDFDEVIHILWNREFADNVVKIFRHTLETGESFATPQTSELRADRGTTESFEWRTDRIALPEGGYGVVCYFRDISALVQARASLLDHQERLRKAEKLAAAGQLAASLAHEINNPLSSVVNALYLLESHASLDPPARLYVNLAASEVGRVARIVQQSLAYHRVGAVPQDVDVTRIVRDSLAIFNDRCQRAGVVCQARLRSANVVVGFANELRQVVDNLLLNALEAMPAGGKLVVSVRDSRDWRRSRPNGVRLTIVDSGTGMPRDVRKRIFEPFFTTKAEKGTGLGLWVLQGIVTKHDGTITVKSSDGTKRHGTAVSVYLPAHASASHKVEDSSESAA